MRETTYEENREQAPYRQVGFVRLWIGVLGPPIAWSLHLLISYPLVPLVCATGWMVLLYAVSAATILLGITAGLIAWQSWRQLRGRQPVAPGPGRHFEARHFMAISGMVLAVLFVTVTIAETIPIFAIDPCAY